MKSRGWNLAQSLQWVKERRPSVDLTQGHTANLYKDFFVYFFQLKSYDIKLVILHFRELQIFEMTNRGMRVVEEVG